MPVEISTPVWIHTAPFGHDRKGVPLQYRHSLPNPRQCGDQLGSGRWKTSAGLSGVGEGTGDAAVAGLGVAATLGPPRATELWVQVAPRRIAATSAYFV